MDALWSTADEVIDYNVAAFHNAALMQWNLLHNSFNCLDLTEQGQYFFGHEIDLSIC